MKRCMKYRRSLLKGSLKTINFPCSFFFSDLQFTNCYSSFKLRVEINRKLSWSCFTSLCDWSRKLAPLSQPIRFKPKTNRDLVTHVFPRFKQFACLFLWVLIPRSVIGQENSRHCLNQSDWNLKTNRDLVTHVFLRFKQFACLYSEFSLASWHISFTLICYCNYFGFGLKTLTQTSL